MNSLQFRNMFLFSLCFKFVIIHNFLLKLFLLNNSLVFDVYSFLVRDLHLCHQDCCLSSFLFRLSDLFRFQLFNLFHNQGFLSFLNFSLLNSLHFSLLYLIDNDKSSLLLRVFSLSFSFFLVLKTFQSFNLHHDVESLLLRSVLILKSLLLFELLISDGYTFRVDYHLVHMLHIVFLLI